MFNLLLLLLVSLQRRSGVNAAAVKQQDKLCFL